MDLDWLYDRGPCFVLNKPPGLATQAPVEFDSLERRLRAFLKQREGKSGNIYLGVPHRLDRPASGAIVFARHARAAQRISAQFERRTVGKRYWACLSGQVEPETGTWEDYVAKVYGRPRAEIVSPKHPHGRLAVLRYRTLARRDWGAWLEIELETGRTHQVRVQAAARGWPVLGDVQYGSTLPFGPQDVEPRARAIALHARRLTLRHPTLEEAVDVTAPLPACWAELSLPEADAAGR